MRQGRSSNLQMGCTARFLSAVVFDSDSGSGDGKDRRPRAGSHDDFTQHIARTGAHLQLVGVFAIRERTVPVRRGKLAVGVSIGLFEIPGQLGIAPNTR